MKRQGKIVMDKKISKYKIANCINVLGNFCGKRDIDELTAFELMKKYGVEKADVMVLFGGSILARGDILGNATKNDVAKKYVIVGEEDIQQPHWKNSFINYIQILIKIPFYPKFLKLKFLELI